MLEKYFSWVALIVAVSGWVSTAIARFHTPDIKWPLLVMLSPVFATFYSVLFVIVMQFGYRPSLRVARRYTILMGLIQAGLTVLYYVIDRNSAPLLYKITHHGGTIWIVYLTFLLGVPLIGYITRDPSAVLHEQTFLSPHRPRSWQLAILSMQLGLFAGSLLWFAGSITRVTVLAPVGKVLILLGVVSGIIARLINANGRTN